MKRHRHILLLGIAFVALILLVVTFGLWGYSRHSSDLADFSRFDRSFELRTDPNQLLWRVSNLSPTMTASVTGMAETADGWATTPGNAVTIKLSALSIRPNEATGVQGKPLTIIRPRFQFHGFEWASGFTTQHAVLPGPFQASEVNTITLSYTTAVVVLGLVVLIAGFLGLRASRQNAEGRCPHCGRDLGGSSDRCPECGMVVQNVSSKP